MPKRETIGGALLTDHDLVAATATSRVREYEETGQRVYTARFVPGRGDIMDPYREVTFAVGHAEAAAIYAREYAARILGAPWRVKWVRWAR